MSCRPVVGQIAWTDQYRIGVAAIDRDHEGLIRVYNHIVSTLSLESESKVNEEAIIVLKSYADTHFKMEEDVMLAAGYPDYVNHKSEHKLFYNYVDDLAVSIANNEEASSDFVEFLGHWIITHVLVMDLQIAEYLRSGGDRFKDIGL